MFTEVKPLTNKEIEKDNESTDKVEQIKERVEEKEGIPPAQQRLIFSGKQMNHNKVSYHKISCRPNINLQPMLPFATNKIPPPNKSINSHKKIHKLKNKGPSIRKKKEKAFFNAFSCKNSTSIEVKRIKERIEEKEIENDNEAKDKVEQIKERLEEKEIIPPAQQRLILSRKQMNHKTVSSHKISCNSIVTPDPMLLPSTSKIHPPIKSSKSPKKTPTLKTKGPTIRKKKERACLTGHSCKNCISFFQGLGENSVQAHSRHRADVTPPKTPPHFWEVDFPSTPECKRRGYIN